MQISRKSRLYKVAYCMEKGNDRPDRVSLCRLFWRFVLFLPLFYLVILPLSIVVIGLFFLFAFLFAQRLACPERDADTKNFSVPIAPDKWPKIKGHRIWPITVLLLGLLIYYSSSMIGPMTNFACQINQAASWVDNNLGVVSIISGVVLVVGFFFSDFFQLVALPYLKARKEKVCPYVDFVD